MATYESRRYNVPVTDASKIADGSVNNTEFQHLDGVTSDIQGQVDSKLNLNGGVMTGSVTSNDNVRARFGSSNDLQIYHDGSNSIINNSVGALVVNADTLQLKNGANNATLATFTQGGNNNLRFNGSTKLETTSTGVSVTGELGATGNITAGANVNGNGQNLTNLNASNLASGTVADARISTLTASKLTGALPAIDGSNLTGLEPIPASTDSVGQIKTFAFYAKSSSTPTNTYFTFGSTFTPNTFDSNLLYITTDPPINLTTHFWGYIRSGGRAIQNITGGRSTEGGTWKAISSGHYESTAGQGQVGPSAKTYGFLAQRIS